MSTMIGNAIISYGHAVRKQLSYALVEPLCPQADPVGAVVSYLVHHVVRKTN